MTFIYEDKKNCFSIIYYIKSITYTNISHALIIILRFRWGAWGGDNHLRNFINIFI